MNLQDSCAPATQPLLEHTRAFNSILTHGISSERGVQVTPDTLRSDLAENDEKVTTIQNTSLLPPFQIPAQPTQNSSASPSLQLFKKATTPSAAQSRAASTTASPSSTGLVPPPPASSSSASVASSALDAPFSKFHTPPPDAGQQDMSVVTPFLVKHISDQSMIPKDNFHKFCYRHNPDVTCNKTTDEAKMKKIQKKMEKLPSRDQEALSHVWSIFSAAPDQHRSLILQGILSQCCFPQLSFIAQEVSQLIRIDFISTLPMEISLKILCYLDCNSLCNAAQVSRKWKSLADDDRVWHHMCEQHIDRKCPNCGWGLPLMHMKRAREYQGEYDQEVKRRKTEAASSDPSATVTPSNSAVTGDSQASNTDSDITSTAATAAPASSSVVASSQAVTTKLKRRAWKSVYSERYKLEKNWRKGIHTIKTFYGHTDDVTCLQFNRKYLMTGSYDSTIRIWKVDTGQCLKVLSGHTKGIRSLVFDSQKLITGGLDNTIKVWNYHTGQCISTYRGHDAAVVSVDFCNKTIVSGSADHTVKVWHVDSRTCYTLRGHSSWVNSVKIHSPSNTVFSASDDTTIRMWDLENNQCLRIFGGIENNGHIGQIQSVIPFIYKDDMDYDKNSDSDNEIIEDENGVAVPGARSGRHGQASLTAIPDGDEASSTEEINEIQLPTNANYPTHLLSASLDNTIKLWDIKTGKCIRTQFGHIEGVWSISSDTFRIISGAHDRLVKVWDLQSGKCLHTFGNSSSVSAVALSDSKFCVGMENGNVKMYCFDDES